MKGYDTAEYAGSRLNETVVRLEDKPVMVLHCSPSVKDNISIKYEDIMSGEVGKAPIHKFNLDPVPLGYVNCDGKAHYVTRMPLRQDWKQGFRQRSICDVNGFGVTHLSFRTIGYTIMGKFPAIKTILNSVSSNGGSMAFSRDFAVDHYFRLHYKSLFEVGKVNQDNGGIAIDDSYSWVREALDETLEAVA